MARKIIKQTASFGVLRANPRISGNVKITIDSEENIWLNSIDSNPEMSNQAYKAFRISESSSYDKDLYYFFNKGQTPPQFVFGLIGEGNPVQNQIEDLSLSYNFTYSAGVTPLISDRYPEDFSYLAPFWIGDDIPDYFVIFKINDPIDYSYRVPVSSISNNTTYKVLQDPSVDTSASGYLPFLINYAGNNYSDGDIFTGGVNPNFTILQGQGTVVLLDPLYHLGDVEDTSSHFYNKILPKATIVSTYSLKEDSKIGKYLRNIKANAGYTDSLIDVRFEENQLTTYNGVNYNAGIFDKKGDFLLDYYTNPETQIGFEEFMTDGFRRNGIISYKLLNLEFLFNDNDSENYTINRYFGLYVNAPDLSSFKLNGDSFFKDQGNSGNTPVPIRNDKGYYYQESSYYQYNDNGIRLFIDPNYVSGIIPDSDTVNILENVKLFWVKDKYENFHSLKRDENYANVSPDPSTSVYGLTGSENQIVIQDTVIDLSVFTGADSSTKKQYGGVQTGEKGRAYSVIRIGGQLTTGNDDSFIFYHPLGTYGNPGERYDIIEVSDMSSVIDEWGPGSFYAQGSAYYIHPFGTNEDIAKALAGVFNSFNYNSFEAFNSGDEVVIRTRATGSKENTKYYLDFFQDPSISQRMPDSRRGVVFINEKDVCDINQRQPFVGGSDYSITRVKVLLQDANKIEVGKTFLETIRKTSTDSITGYAEFSDKGASMVIGKYRFVDQYATTEDGEIIGLKDFETHATLEIANFNERISVGSVNKIIAFNTYDITLGVFSFYGLREIDMDFWYSQYGYTPTQEYYKYLDIQPDGITKVVPDRTYYVSSGSIIEYNSINITGPDFFQGVIGEENYTLLSSSSSAESNVYPTISSRGNVTVGVTAGFPSGFDTAFYPDLDAFPGFYGVQALKFVNDTTGIETKYSQLNFGKLDSEYNYNEENYTTSFATKSRVSPYISKWVYRGGTDIRGNGYRLNANIAFSPLNFSPSFFRRAQDPQYFTHEWLQLQKPPYSLPEDNLKNDKSYLAGEIDETLLSDADPAIRDYFLDYFSIEGEDLMQFYPNSNTVQNIDLTERYSVFDFNQGNGFSETLFRGAKIRIKRTFTDYGQGESVKYLTDDRFYDDYKFSCVIIPIANEKESIQAPVKIKVVENRTFKNITFILKIVVDDARLFNFEDISPEIQYLDLDYFLMYSLKDKIEQNYVPVSSPGPSLPSGSIELPMVGDIKLSSALNVSSNPNSAGLFSVVNTGTIGTEGEIYIVPNPEYETDLRDEISFVYVSSIVPGATSSTGPGSFYGYAGGVGPTGTYTLPFVTGVNQNSLNFTNTGVNYFFDFTPLGLPGPVTVIPTVASYPVISAIPIYQRGGGSNYWKNIFEKISFANLSLWVNSSYPYIDYETYEWDETSKTTKVLNDQFVLEFLKPSAFDQNTILVAVEDTNKPPELNPFVIGYDVEQVPGKTELYRYGGEYVPSFREILKFENIKYDIPYWLTPSSYPFTFEVKIESKQSDSLDYDLGSQNCYSIEGKLQNNIVLIKGASYIFDLSDSSNLGYQLYFSSSKRGNDYPNDALLTGYTLFGTPGNLGSYIQFDVPYNFPDDVYYVAQGGKYMGAKTKVIDPIEYAYCSFGPDRNGFGNVKNVNYYKYATEWIFRIGKNSPYNPLYNLIGESPVDKRDLSLFESSWDPGFYRQYTSPTSYTSLPGTRSMQEQKAFFGSKVMQTPDSISTQKQIVYPTSLSNVFELNYENFPGYEILWEETSTEIRGILLVDRMLTRYFLEDGGKQTFQEFIIPEFGFGSLSDVDDDFREYMRLNVIPIFQTKDNGAYLKKIPLDDPADLVTVVGDLADYQKIINGYLISSDIRFTKVNELRYEFRIPKDPSFDYSLAFSIRIGKI